MLLKQHMFRRNNNVISPRGKLDLLIILIGVVAFGKKSNTKLGNNVIVPSKQHSQCESHGCTMNLFHFDAV